MTDRWKNAYLGQQLFEFRSRADAEYARRQAAAIYGLPISDTRVTERSDRDKPFLVQYRVEEDSH